MVHDVCKSFSHDLNNSSLSSANGGKTVRSKIPKRVSPTKAISLSIIKLIEPFVWPGVSMIFKLLSINNSWFISRSAFTASYSPIHSAYLLPKLVIIFVTIFVPLGSFVNPFCKYPDSFLWTISLGEYLLFIIFFSHII